jgi:hypothetical protein
MTPVSPSLRKCLACRSPLRDTEAGRAAEANMDKVADAIRLKIAEGQRSTPLPWEMLNIPEQEMWRGVAGAGLEVAQQ